MLDTRLSALVVLASLPPALVINEICYDPPGADAGGEFVELHNPGSQAIAYRDLRLEFANGAEEPRWRVQWECAAEITLPAGAFFLIADEGWDGPAVADAVADLALQNGPDAVRLSAGTAAIDRVGYGELEWPALYEGRPATGVEAGRALARRPDGHDTDDNAADFVAAAPTPRARNFALHALDLLWWRCEPPAAVRSGDAMQLSASLRAAGLAELPSATGYFRCGERALTVSLNGLAPANSLAVAIDFAAPDTGRWPLRLVWPLPAPAGSLDLELGVLAVGPQDVVINEVMAAPVAGGEWIELRNCAATPLDPAELRIRDADGGWRDLPAGPSWSPGGLVVLAEDEPAFREHWPAVPEAAGVGCELPAGQPVRVPSWPALNNSAPDSRSYADRVVLADRIGVIDYVTLGPADANGDGHALAGRSLERLAIRPRTTAAANWAPCAVAAGGTPGCPNSVAVTGSSAAALRVAPNPFTPGRGEESVVQLGFTLAGTEAAYDLRLYDLWGGLVRDLGGDHLGPGRRQRVWDGRDDGGDRVPTGAYIVLLRRRDDAGLVLRAEKALVAVIGSDGE